MLSFGKAQCGRDLCMREYCYPCLTELVAGVLSGDNFDLARARRCLSAGLRADALEEALLDLSHAMDHPHPNPALRIGDRHGFDHRLQGVLAVLNEAPPVAPASAGDAARVVEIATFPGDSEIGALLWATVLACHGYVVHPFGVRAAPVVAAHAAQSAADALLLHIGIMRSRASVQAVVAHLARRAARVPILVGGPGVDAEFAQRVAVLDGGRPYWGGLYYCEDAREMQQVLQQVILFEPPPVAHEHSTSSAPDACTGCDGCSLASGCSLP